MLTQCATTWMTDLLFRTFVITNILLIARNLQPSTTLWFVACVSPSCPIECCPRCLLTWAMWWTSPINRITEHLTYPTRITVCTAKSAAVLVTSAIVMGRAGTNWRSGCLRRASGRGPRSRRRGASWWLSRGCCWCNRWCCHYRNTHTKDISTYLIICHW